MIKGDTQIKFNYNPFGGLTTEELSKVLVPQIDLEQLLKEIDGKRKILIEFVGEKGRGKTSHLKMLHEQCSSSELFLLTRKAVNFDEIDRTAGKVLLIDSIHHLNFWQRQKLYRSKQKIVLTTHTSRFLEYRMLKLDYRSYKFKGIAISHLAKIIERRMSLAADPSQIIRIDESALQGLIDKYQDDYRSILHHLYQNFQS